MSLPPRIKYFFLFLKFWSNFSQFNSFCLQRQFWYYFDSIHDMHTLHFVGLILLTSLFIHQVIAPISEVSISLHKVCDALFSTPSISSFFTQSTFEQYLSFLRVTSLKVLSCSQSRYTLTSYLFNYCGRY